MFVFTSGRCVICALIIVVASACSSTAKVQICTQHLLVDDRVYLARRLSDANFDVSFNDTPIPAGIRHTTLIYSPLIQDSHLITSLVELLETTRHGIPRLELTGKENHYYSRVFWGFTLFPRGRRR